MDFWGNNQRWRRILFFFFCTFLLILGAVLLTPDAGLAAANSDANEKVQMDWKLLALSVFVLVGTLAGMLCYMWQLQKQYRDACIKANQLNMYIETPAGLQTGTVRSFLTFFIVVLSMYMVLLSAFNVYERVPEIVAAAFTAVLGFYFGTRSSSRTGESALVKDLKKVQQEKDALEKKEETLEVDTLMDKVKKGIKVASAATDLLPESVKKKYESPLKTLKMGEKLADGLLSKGKVSGAIAQLKDTYEDFRSTNPLTAIAKKAVAAFGAVSPIVPATALVAVIIGVGAKLAGVKYDKWKARILHAPFSPSVYPLDTVDADFAISRVQKIPELLQAYKEKFETSDPNDPYKIDRPFFKKMAFDFLKKETEALKPTYFLPFTFDSEQEFEDAVETFRRSAVDRELSQKIEADLFAEANGYEKVVEAIDSLRNDPQASEDLDMLVDVVDGLNQQGAPMAAIAEKIKEELQP
jgi:hypothetical protein